MKSDSGVPEKAMQDADGINHRATDMKTDFDLSPIQTDTVSVAPIVGHTGNGAINTAAINTSAVGDEAVSEAAIGEDGRATTVAPAEVGPIAGVAAPAKRPSRRRTILICVGLAVLGLAIYFGVPAIYRFFRYESTDDAFVNAHVTYVAPRIAGRVMEVLVDNNQYVEAGQPLVRIDREPFQIAVEQKQAALKAAKQTVDQQVAALDVAQVQVQQARDQARGQLAAVYADWYMLQTVQTLIGYEVAALKSGVANWKLQQANLELAQANLKRGQELVPQGAMSREEFESRQAAAKVAKQQVDAAVQAVEQARALLGLSTTTRPDGTPETTVPSDIDETFPGVKYVVASAEQSLAQLGLPIDPSAAQADKVVDKISSLVASSFIDHVPTVEVAEAQLRQAQAGLGGESFDRAHPYNQPSVVQAQKDLDQAELNLSYCELRAPLAGYVNGRSVNPGDQVQVAQALMSVFPLKDVWIDANFKEGQLDRLRIGQSVDLYVDAYPGHVFPGRIAGFSAGTGAALSLLPPENATGNFVKVVQRLPVRIELTGPAPQDTPLFIGLSVEPEVDLWTEPRGPDAGQRLRGPLPQQSK